MNDTTEIDTYIGSFPDNIQTRLTQLRTAIRNAAPDAIEVISYKMPAFKMRGILIWYAAYKHHIGLYPKVASLVYFKDQLKDYKTSKGTIQFPIDKPLPLELISRIVQFNAKQDDVISKKHSDR